MRPAFTVIWKRSLLDQTIPTMLVSEMDQGRSIAQVTDALNLVYPDEHIACVRSVRLVRGGEPPA